MVLPVLMGLAWNLLGPRLSGPPDEVLGLLTQGVAPVCLMTIGMSLAYYGLAGAVREALTLTVAKLIALPAAILVTAHWVAHLHGTALSTMVIFGGLPIGTNALMFARRYHAKEAEVTAATMVSTLGFTITAPLWLLLLGAVG